MPVRIEPLRREDAPRCAELEQQLFSEDDPWSAEAFVAAVEVGHHYLAARDGERLVGYAGLAITSSTTAEIHTIAVDTPYQGTGVGRELLTRLLDHAPRMTVFLEVRTDNEPAIALYRSAGFEIVGTRPRYYRPSGADAYTMKRRGKP